MGRDVLSRVLYGGQLSLRVAFLVIAIAMSGGVLLGLATGYYGGWLDLLVMRLVDILLAFPTILLLLAIVAALGTQPYHRADRDCLFVASRDTRGWCAAPFSRRKITIT